MSFMHMDSFLAAVADSAAFELDLNNNSFRATDQNGGTTRGTLFINSDGSISWTGDTFGTNESGMTWFVPVGETDGTGFSVRIDFDGGTNQYDSLGSDDLGSWLALTSNRDWRFTKPPQGSGGGTTVGTYNLQFSDDGGLTTLESVIFTVTLKEETI